jgi:hypothetical protein
LDRQSSQRSQEFISLLSPLIDFFFLPQEEASKAMNKKSLEGVATEKGAESQAMEEEKAEGHV